MGNTADIVQVILTVVVMFFTLLGNTCIFYTIFRVRRLHCPSGFLLANLAVIDILVALTLLPFRIPGILYEKFVFKESGCIVIGFLQNSLSFASVFTLLAVSIDRYLAIVLPLRYKSFVTATKTATCILFIWIYSLFSACYPFFGWGRYAFIRGLWLCETDYLVHSSFTVFKLCSIYFLPLLIISYLYAQIFRVSRRHSKQIRSEVEAMVLRESSTVVEVDTAVGKIQDVSGQFCLRKPHSAMKSEIRTALTLGFVVGVLFLSWTPYIGLSIWSTFTRENNDIIGVEISTFLYYLNGMINPYLYGYLNRTIKAQLRKYYNNFVEKSSRLRKNRVTPAIIVITPKE